MLYFAHPVSDYGTVHEADCLAAIETAFSPPDCEIRVYNPNSPAGSRGYRDHGMRYFEGVIGTCSALVYRSFGEGAIGAGVACEIACAIGLGLPVDELVETTRGRLGGRPRRRAQRLPRPRRRADPGPPRRQEGGMTDRDVNHLLPSGEMLPEETAPNGTKVTGRHVFRFQQGLRPDHAAALDARPDLCARLWREGIDPEVHWFAVSAEELDAGIDAMLKEPTP